MEPATKAMDDFAHDLQSESVQIFVGPQNEGAAPYVVPKALLCSLSSYFRKALSPNFKEGQSNVLHFPEDTNEGWAVLLYYVFHGQVPSIGSIEDGAATTPYFTALTHAYLLGDKYRIPKFQNHIVRTFIKGITNNKLEVKCILEIAELVPSTCPIRKLAIEEAVVLVHQDQTHRWEEFEALNKYEDAFFDLLNAAKELSRWGPDGFPPHEYGENEDEIWMYLVREDDED